MIPFWAFCCQLLLSLVKLLTTAGNNSHDRKFSSKREKPRICDAICFKRRYFVRQAKEDERSIDRYHSYIFNICLRSTYDKFQNFLLSPLQPIIQKTMTIVRVLLNYRISCSMLLSNEYHTKQSFSRTFGTKQLSHCQ